MFFLPPLPSPPVPEIVFGIRVSAPPTTSTSQLLSFRSRGRPPLRSSSSFPSEISLKSVASSLRLPFPSSGGSLSSGWRTFARVRRPGPSSPVQSSPVERPSIFFAPKTNKRQPSGGSPSYIFIISPPPSSLSRIRNFRGAVLNAKTLENRKKEKRSRPRTFSIKLAGEERQLLDLTRERLYSIDGSRVRLKGSQKKKYIYKK